MYDAIIIGARCAGSATAMLLARKGYRVLLVDRAAFPSDTISTHYIQPRGVQALKRWKLLDRIIASKCPPIRRVVFDLGAFALQGFPASAQGIQETYCPRRIVLDKILVDAAVAAGVEVRERLSVHELIREGDRVVGIRSRTTGDRVVSERAKLVIGADGVASLVARQVGAVEYDVAPPLTCAFYAYWRGIPVEHLESYPRPHGRCMITAFPTNEGRTCIFVARPHSAFAACRANIDGNYVAALRLVPNLAARVEAGRREGTFRGIGNLPGFFRKPYGPGWALVGDAAYHKDPITAQGISDAFCHAEMLADAVDAGFKGNKTLPLALAEYEQRRNMQVREMYYLTCWSAALEPQPPQREQLFAALRGNQCDTDQFLGTLAGTVSISRFFAPENVNRILAAGAAPTLVSNLHSASSLQTF